jgi:hypothetical protein
MFAQRFLTAVLAALCISLTIPSASSAGFVSVSGPGNILDPAATSTGATANFFNDTGANRVVHAWNERQNVTLDHDLFVDITRPGVFDHNHDLGYYNQHRIAAGRVVSSHLLYFDPRNSHRVENVVFTFDEPIVGIIVASDRFFTAAHNFTDYFLDSDYLGNPLSVYPTAHFEDRGLELNQFDEFTFSVSGNRLCLNWGASTPGDQIRVITARPNRELTPVPAPPGLVLALAGSALLILGGLIRRRVLAVATVSTS